jgi:hypothetical protein
MSLLQAVGLEAMLKDAERERKRERKREGGRGGGGEGGEGGKGGAADVAYRITCSAHAAQVPAVLHQVSQT